MQIGVKHGSLSPLMNVETRDKWRMRKIGCGTSQFIVKRLLI
jgi:hypothetical protein